MTITARTSSVTAAIIRLGELSLQFGLTNRATYHPDGITPESDTDHTVMLGLIACAFADLHRELGLDMGLVAQYALVHDLVEVYAGDTPTLRQLSADAAADKAAREHDAYLRIAEEFAFTLPWVATTIADYELRRTPEARYVKALDKLLPKITHLLNDCATVREQGMDAEALAARYRTQPVEMRAYAADFPAVFELRAELVDLVLQKYKVGGTRCS